jgi:hypothetical protein|tara:strand:+ start:1099 stop:1584 length:486 start_codon:yes stop_codon:yes gene_type:complete
MKKCNLCGNEISEYSNKVICNKCDKKFQPSIENRNLEIILVIAFFIIGLIYTYGGFYSIKYKEPFFENSIYWIVTDLVGCFLVYKWNWTDGLMLEGGVGAFFGIPIVTFLGLINLILLPIIPENFSDLFYGVVSFPPLNFLVGLTCLWSSVININSVGKQI